MSRFDTLKKPVALSAPSSPVLSDAAEAATKRPDRAGKKMVGGHYSAELSRAVNILAAERGVTVQALVGEALDLLLRHHGKHPFGER